MNFHKYKKSFSYRHSFVYLSFQKMSVSKEQAQSTIGNQKLAAGIKVQEKRDDILKIAKSAENPINLAKALGMKASTEFMNFAEKNPAIKKLISKLKSNALQQFINFRGTLNKITKFTQKELGSFNIQKLHKLFVKIKGLRDRTLNLMEATKDKVADKVKYNIKAENKRSSMLEKSQQSYFDVVGEVFKDGGDVRGRARILYLRYKENNDPEGWFKSMSHTEVMDFKSDAYFEKQKKVLISIAEKMVEYEKNKPTIGKVSQTNGNIKISGENLKIANFKVKPDVIEWSQAMKMGASSLSGKMASFGDELKNSLKNGLQKAFKDYPEDINETLIAKIEGKVDYGKLGTDILKRTIPTILIEGTATADGGSYSSNLALAKKRGEAEKASLMKQFPGVPANKFVVRPYVVGPGGGTMKPGQAKEFYKDLAERWNERLEKDSGMPKDEKELLQMTAGNIKSKLNDFDNNRDIDERMSIFLQGEVADHRGAKVEIEFKNGEEKEMLAVNFASSQDSDAMLASR